VNVEDVDELVWLHVELYAERYTLFLYTTLSHVCCRLGLSASRSVVASPQRCCLASHSQLHAMQTRPTWDARIDNTSRLTPPDTRRWSPWWRGPAPASVTARPDRRAAGSHLTLTRRAKRLTAAHPRKPARNSREKSHLSVLVVPARVAGSFNTRTTSCDWVFDQWVRTRQLLMGSGPALARRVCGPKEAALLCCKKLRCFMNRDAGAPTWRQRHDGSRQR